MTVSPAITFRPPPLAEMYAPVRDDLRRVERIFDDELRGDLPFVEALCEVVRSYRGKMLRPALLLLSGKACGALTNTHHTLAAVVEMVHMATLVHDDVLDEAGQRRKQPTVASLSGNVAAVLVGDYLISHAYHLCSSLESQHASRRIASTTNTVCEGEMLQNHYRGRLDLSTEAYLDLIRRKTASLTATSCELGAWASGADAEVSEALRQYGMSAGMAFQIIDDVLDLVGQEQEVGKTLGQDIALGKATLPVIHALSCGQGSTPEALRRLLSNGADRREVCSLLESAGSLAHATSLAEQYVQEALGHLEWLPEGLARESLAALAGFIVQRRH